MDFSHSPRSQDMLARVRAFLDLHYYPYEADIFAEVEKGNRWQPLSLVENLKKKAKAEGLWNLFLPDSTDGAGLGNCDYAPLAEEMGRSPFASEIFNCSAPDTGNMEVLVRYGTQAQKDRWLKPLLAGDIRSGFAMTEPDVASSDARNIRASIERDGDSYVLNGRKWWTSGAGDPRCKILIFMGQSAPDHENPWKRQSMILVPMDTPGITINRMLPVFGYDDAPHGHADITFNNVRVPADNMILGEGRGFEIAQGRLGPGRIHHCMRLIGLTERALERMCIRLTGRTAFGKMISDHSVWDERIAQSRVMIDSARLLTMKAAYIMDKEGNKAAKKDIAMIKVAAPTMACQVIDWAIQAHGAAGVSDDYGLAYAYAQARTLRLADGPDEVHCRQIARLELKAVTGRI